MGKEKKDVKNGETKKPLSETEEEKYPLTPEEATSFEASNSPSVAGGAGWFNRKGVLMVLSFAFVLVVGGGLLFNTLRSTRGETEEEEPLGETARAPRDLLESLKEDAERRKNLNPEELPPSLPPEAEAAPYIPEAVSRPRQTAGQVPQAQQVPEAPPSRTGGGGSGAGNSPDPLLAAKRSSLVPRVEGSLFGNRGGSSAGSGGAGGNQNEVYGDYGYGEAGGGYGGNYGGAADPMADYTSAILAAQRPLPEFPAETFPPSPYADQNNQTNKQEFYDAASGGGGSIGNGRFIPDNSLWIGTIIPGILETAINTDLPGNVIARVTQNVYDSRTGKALLIPQGTILVAQYNSSVSYAQHRVQIVWDSLIRPDGFHLELEGMNSVDTKGMSGQAAKYKENWFEYLKAAGIITLFSVANSKMTETAAKYASETTAAGIAQANTEFVNEMGGNIVGRVMNIQPTLTVESGTGINIMLNKNLFLPPVKDFKTTQRYVRE